MARFFGIAILSLAIAATALPLRAEDSGGVPPPESPAPAVPDQPSADAPKNGDSTDDSNGDNGQVCVDVEVGGDRSAYYSCLNERMKHQVESEHQKPVPNAPIDTHSPQNQLGTANDAAARQSMGNSFGKSAIPQRPTRNFVNPIVPGSH
jgi:hypothetical protein